MGCRTRSIADFHMDLPVVDCCTAARRWSTALHAFDRADSAAKMRAAAT